jgi:hypothetical protein
MTSGIKDRHAPVIKNASHRKKFAYSIKRSEEIWIYEIKKA